MPAARSRDARPLPARHDPARQGRTSGGLPREQTGLIAGPGRLAGRQEGYLILGDMLGARRAGHEHRHVHRLAGNATQLQKGNVRPRPATQRQLLGQAPRPDSFRDKHLTRGGSLGTVGGV